MYPDLAHVPATGPGFQGEKWLRQCGERVENTRLMKTQLGYIPPSCLRQDHLLSLLIAAARSGGRDVKILDFGGGLGVSYEALRDQCGDMSPGSYHVIEGRGLCAMGRDLFKGDNRIAFHEDFPEDPRTVDVVFVSTVMQYVPDYAGALERLASYAPRYFLFTEFSASAAETFATGQVNVQGSVIPYRFISLKELEDLMAGLGYSLTYQEALENPYPSPWPEKAPFFWNILFDKTGVSSS